MSPIGYWDGTFYCAGRWRNLGITPMNSIVPTYDSVGFMLWGVLSRNADCYKAGIDFLADTFGVFE